MKVTTAILILFLCAFATHSTAQSNQNITPKVAQKTNVNRDIDLITVYEQYVIDGYGTPAIYKKLASGNYFKSNYQAAKKWYEKLFETQAPTQTQLFRYNQSLKAIKKRQHLEPKVIIN